MAPMDSFGRPQTVLLLGAKSGIGQAIVARMVGDGARHVILAGRDPEGLTRPEFDADVDHVYFDAAETSAHRKFFDELFETHPAIDVVVVAFGVLRDQMETEAEPELAVEMAEVNYVGAVSALLHASKGLRDRGGGQIVVLSSVAGVTPRRSNFAYGSSKAAVDFFARGLAASLKGTEVRMLVVRPGFVRTAMTAGMKARPFAVSPEKVADAVVEAMAHRSEEIWVPSVLRWVMPALRMLPAGVVEKLDR
jgi:decaprenylphospho-beta-D-erythro-pentofuranosid-2-ulose 2-reductase